ncbi:MAG: GNAT family N-acetyltransferase [Armatimonadetes bacterium]|nr:GNAT family N-acetyltransferase [Armatimonadota bacterium]
MEQKLAEVTLKSGEPMSVIKVTAPAPEWQERILPFLQHKGDPWLWQMKSAIAEGLPGADQHFFEGVLEDGTIVGNITTVEAHDPPIGLLQHVFTPPEHRRKGIASALMRALCDDFQARGGRVMYLHTGHDSPPYHIYASYGFAGHEDTGAMSWTLEEGFREKYFAPAPAQVHDTDWCDWVPLEALSWTVEGWRMRSFLLGKYGFSGFEGDYPRLRKAMEEGQVRDFKVLRTDAGVVAGYAFAFALRGWPGAPWGLDMFVHPNFEDDAARLAAAVELPDDTPVVAWSDSGADAKNSALEAAGLRRAGAIAGLLEEPSGGKLDAVIYSRT